MTAPLLELEGVRVGPADHPRLQVERGVVRAGERIALLGANGAGKTTWLRVAGGWTAPDAGEVRLDGAPLHRVGRRAAARRVAAVLADEEAPFATRVRDVVALGRHPWGGRLGSTRAEDDAHVEQALARTGLAAFAERSITTLSSGERQRVALARALAQDAAVLLVDEATAHLDLARREELARILAEESDERGRAVVAVMHDLDLAAAWAHRAVVLAAGQVVADGPAADVIVAERLQAWLGVPLLEVVVGPDEPPRLLVARGGTP
ncbi:MAG: ABC transporter ATP-binding protein [Planctomycetes bacterium]|nr:ABC transporter ATP-binding protein [Planctomycetota bacterium]MCB9825377.1 ABC transporter ATP-binding protein [Planctomycetota bacterium]MCB9900859.1 ABC transporter ATP-binding protein [Planctomycetota bacterium]